MSRPTTPSFNIVGVSQEGLNFIDEFEELMEDFDATPRPDETRISSSRSESACSVTVLECKQLLQPRPVESRSGSATSKRPLTGEQIKKVLESPILNFEFQILIKHLKCCNAS